MVAALVVPVSGPYTATYGGGGNNYLLGTQDDDGYILQGTYQAQEVAASDAFGLTLVEAINRGINWRIRFRGLEFNKPGILNALQVFGSTGSPLTTFTPTLANIGDRYSKFAQGLVLSAILGNPPTFIQSLTALNAVMAPQTNIAILMTSKMREAPIEMVLLPYQATVASLTVNLAFTTT